MPSNSVDQQLNMMGLRRLKGHGRLRCQHGTTWNCAFSITHLLNGRLQVIVMPSSERRNWSKLIDCHRQCEPLEVEGMDEKQRRISANTIHITCVNYSHESLIGYARSVAYHPEKTAPSDRITLKHDLFNFRLTGRVSPVKVQIDSFDVEIGHLGWPDQWMVREHSKAYRHPTISTRLSIKDISVAEQDAATEGIYGILELLSVANRGYVFSAARHIGDADGRWLSGQLEEPHFTKPGWPRALIPSDSLEDFLTAAYPHMNAKYRSLELAHVIDHYLQALTLRSSWPISLGIFTAMETLKAAFFREQGDKDAKFQFWVVPPDDFAGNREVLDDLIEALGKHFSRFRNLDSSERDSLKAKLRDLNRRSYRTQLRRMLEQLNVSHSKGELQSFIAIRNSIIHQGRPTENDGWKQVEGAASLFERVLLGVLGYEGPNEPFDAEIEQDK